MSFRNELHNAIVFTPGTSKREQKNLEGRSMSWRIYSYSERDALHGMANRFATWAKEERPELRHVRDITYEDKAAFLESCRTQGCSPATLRAYEDRLDKIGHCCNHMYKSSNVTYMSESYCRTVQRDRDRYEYRVRTQVMTPEHYSAIRSTCTRECVSRDALDLSREFGLRAREAVSVRVEDVREDALHVIGKGGREREIPVVTEQQKNLLNRLMQGRTLEERLCPVTTGTYQNYLRDHMIRAGVSDEYPQTGNHSIRKMWAQEQYVLCRNKGLSPEESAGVVTQLLGHGSNRGDLIEVYLKEVYGK